MSAIKKYRKNITWEVGGENVFADLEMPNVEEKLVKAELAFKINEIIAKKKLKQIEAAKLLGVDQAKISLLHRGRLADFSVERLIKFLTLLNQDVDIVIKKTNKVSPCGKFRVLYV